MPYIKDFYFSKEVIINKRFQISKFSVGILSKFNSVCTYDSFESNNKKSLDAKNKNDLSIAIKCSSEALAKNSATC